MKQLPTDTMGQRIKACRKKIKGMTQVVLAEKIGKSRNLVSMLEQDLTNCSLRTIGLIARELNTTTDYLISGIELDRDFEQKMSDFIDSLPDSAKEDILKVTNIVVNLINK